MQHHVQITLHHMVPTLLQYVKAFLQKLANRLGENTVFSTQLEQHWRLSLSLVLLTSSPVIHVDLKNPRNF